MTRIAAGAVVLLLLACPAVASAAAPWSEPVTPGSGAPFSTAPSLSLGALGEAHVRWLAFSRSPRGEVRDAAVARDGSVVAGRSAPVPSTSGFFELPGGRLLLLGRRLRSRDADFNEHVDLSTSVRSRSGVESDRRRLARSARVQGIEVAVSRSGRPAVAWVEVARLRRGQQYARARLRLAVGDRRGRMGAPRTVADLGEHDDTAGRAPVALSYAGDRLVVAFRRELPGRRGLVRTVEALVGPAPGDLERVVLGPHAGRVDLDAVASDSGRIAIGWGTQDGGEEANVPYRVRVAVREPGRGVFSPAQVVDAGLDAARPYGVPKLSASPTGEVGLVWVNATGDDVVATTSPVYAATAAPGSRFGPARKLAEFGVPGEIAFGPDRAAIVTWASLLQVDGNLEPGSPLAALRPAGATRFAAPAEEIAPDTGVTRAPVAAFDPRSGDAVAAWSVVAPDGRSSTPRVARRAAG